MKKHGMSIARRSAQATGLLAALSPGITVAATVAGSLSYTAGQMAATPVPGLGAVGSALLAAGLVLAAWYMRRKGAHLAMLLLLASGALVLASGNALFSTAMAAVNISLGNPQGGTVQVPAGPQVFENTSGATIRVSDVQAPTCNDGPLDIPAIQPPDLCSAGMSLAERQTCATNFPGCAPQQCVSDCSGKECGDDGCGGSCGSCGQGTSCDAGICLALPPPG